MISDQTRSEFPQKFFTVAVHNFKDDPYRENITLHGLFTDAREATLVASQIGDEAYPDFLTAEVVPVQFGTVDQVAAAHGIDFGPVAPQPATTAAPKGSYANPTAESIAAEVAGEAALREQMRAEADGDAWADDGGYGTDADQPRPEVEALREVQRRLRREKAETFDIEAEPVWAEAIEVVQSVIDGTPLRADDPDTAGRPDIRCHYVRPGEEQHGICGVDDYAHRVLSSHPFTPGPHYPTTSQQ